MLFKNIITFGIILGSICLVSAQGETSCRPCARPQNCVNVTAFNVTTEAEVPKDSPFYETLVQDTPDNRNIDSTCLTYFPFSNTSFLKFRTIVYVDGSTSYGAFIMSDVSGSAGIIRQQGLLDVSSVSPVVFNEYAEGVSSPGSCSITYGLYRCPLAGICSEVEETGGSRVAISAVTDPSQCILDEVENILNSAPQTTSEFYRLPKKLPFKCVTRFNNASCLNEIKVPEANRISLPLPTAAR